MQMQMRDVSIYDYYAGGSGGQPVVLALNNTGKAK